MSNGPAPNPESRRTQKRRRTPTAGFRLLPHEGRSGKPPAWPLGDPTVEEAAVWNDVWRLPQAAEWERLGYFRTVARYVRTVIEAELPGAHPSLLSECRQLEDRLGLTPRSMMALRWETDEPLPEEDVPDLSNGASKPRRTYVPKKGPASAGV